MGGNVSEARVHVDEICYQPGRALYQRAITDEDIIDKLLKEIENTDNRAARFVCCVSIVFPNGYEQVFRATCEGEILKGRKGEGGFGYDSVFYFPKAKKTFAELSLDEKNEYSHRAKAIEQLNNYLLILNN